MKEGCVNIPLFFILGAYATGRLGTCGIVKSSP